MENRSVSNHAPENSESLSILVSGRPNLATDNETVGNRRDESQIISDQDMTNETDITELDENMGAKSNSLDFIENEPTDFVSGEVDVKEQMDRTTRAMDDVIERSSGRKAHAKQDTYRSGFKISE